MLKADRCAVTGTETVVSGHSVTPLESSCQNARCSTNASLTVARVHDQYDRRWSWN